MSVRKEARSIYLSRPTMRSMDGAGLAVLIAAGNGWEEALEIAAIQIACGANVLLGLPRQADVAIARARAKAENIGDRLSIARFNRTDPAGMEAALAAYSEVNPPITGALFMPMHAPGELTGELVEASDEDIAAFFDTELVGAIALARRSAATGSTTTPCCSRRASSSCPTAPTARATSTQTSCARRPSNWRGYGATNRRSTWPTAGGGRPNGATRSSASATTSRRTSASPRAMRAGADEGKQDRRSHALRPHQHRRGDRSSQGHAGLQREHHRPASRQGGADHRRIGRDRRPGRAIAGAGRRQGHDRRPARKRTGRRARAHRQRAGGHRLCRSRTPRADAGGARRQQPGLAQVGGRRHAEGGSAASTISSTTPGSPAPKTWSSI